MEPDVSRASITDGAARPAHAAAGSATAGSGSGRRDAPTFRWSWKLVRVAGIDVYVHATFLLLIAFLVVSDLMAGRGFPAMVRGTVLILAVFATVVLHEYGHALMARRFGVRTRDITLLPIGGVARLEKMPDKPGEQLLVALAGPRGERGHRRAAVLAGALARCPGGTQWRG